METITQEARPRAFSPEQARGKPLPAAPGWDLGPERRLDDGRTLARALGWFSIGLGAVEVLAPRRVTRFLGVDERHTKLIRAYGLRELASGAAILSQRIPTKAVASRIAGDVLDLATLGAAFRRDDPHGARVLASMALVAGVMALDVLATKQLSTFAH
jgi:hypothetical protein